LGVPRGHLSLNALYRCLSAVVPHKTAIEEHLVRQGRDLFGFDNDLLLYDLTSTYFEGRMAQNPKAQRGYSRDHRPGRQSRRFPARLRIARRNRPRRRHAQPDDRKTRSTLRRRPAHRLL
jgi:hypothetical protein